MLTKLVKEKIVDYKELIAKLLKGRSVNATAHALGIPQKSLDRYVKGETVPGCKAAKLIAQEAGIPLDEAVEAIIRKEEELVRPKSRSRAHGITATAAGVVMAVNLFLTPTPSQAAPVLKHTSGTIYIMSNWVRRQVSKITAWFAPAMRPATP